jgi:hypothetical protein
MLGAMRLVRLAIENSEHPDKPKYRRGCVDEPTIDALEICEHVIPVLHTMMGMGNDAFKHFLELIGHEERREARRERFWGAAIDVDTEVYLYTTKAEERQFQIVMLKEEKVGIKARKKRKDHRTKQYLYIAWLNDGK